MCRYRKHIKSLSCSWMCHCRPDPEWLGGHLWSWYPKTLNLSEAQHLRPDGFGSLDSRKKQTMIQSEEINQYVFMMSPGCRLIWRCCCSQSSGIGYAKGRAGGGSGPRHLSSWGLLAVREWWNASGQTRRILIGTQVCERTSRTSWQLILATTVTHLAACW